MGLQRDVKEFALGFRRRAPSLAYEAVDLAVQGDCGLAFEEFLSSLNELDIPIGVDETDVAEDIARQLGLSAMLVEGLRGHLVDDDGRRLASVCTVEACNTSATVHEVLQDALELPVSYGRTWDALRDTLAGSADLPHKLGVWDWDALAARLPDDAHRLLSLFLEARRQHPRTAPAIELYSTDDVQLDTGEEHRKLRARLCATPPWPERPAAKPPLRTRS